MTDSPDNNDATSLADATAFMRVLAQILRRLLSQLDGRRRTANNGKRPETTFEGE